MAYLKYSSIVLATRELELMLYAIMGFCVFKYTVRCIRINEIDADSNYIQNYIQTNSIEKKMRQEASLHDSNHSIWHAVRSRLLHLSRMRGTGHWDASIKPGPGKNRY